MKAHANLSSAKDVLPLRTRHREEMNGQIAHDSIHQRAGWTVSYLLDLDEITAGFGTVAIAGPWKDIQTRLEERSGGGEWLLELNGTVAAKGGILFHYNRPYGDIYMEVDESFTGPEQRIE